MERLADGDVDRLVAIKARTLDHGWDYLEIAQLLHDAGRLEDAIGWAERGVAAHADARLRDVPGRLLPRGRAPGRCPRTASRDVP